MIVKIDILSMTIFPSSKSDEANETTITAYPFLFFVMRSFSFFHAMTATRTSHSTLYTLLFFATFFVSSQSRISALLKLLSRRSVFSYIFIASVNFSAPSYANPK